MHEVPGHKPPTVRLRRLAKEMQRLREAAGFASREAAADRVHMDASSLYRLETAKTRPLRRTVLLLLDLYGITGKESQAPYIDLLAKSNELNWLTPYEEALTDDYQTYISFEADAVRLTGAETAFVPGLLQTPEYARALIRGVHPDLPDDNVARRAEVRARRQDALAKKGTKLWMVLDEGALYHLVGGTEVMGAQLDRLLQEDAKRVTVQVIPYSVGAHPASMGSFVLMEFAVPDPDLVYIETLTGSLFVEAPEEVALHRANFEHLIARALSPAETRKMITAKRKEYQ
jgi:hypothetical protein